MSLAIPTTSAVSATIVSQLEASLSQTIPLLPKAFSRVLAKVLAGVFVLLWKYAGFQFLQLFVAYASFQETEINGKLITPLIEWGRLIGVGDPGAATRAELVIDVSVTNQTGQLASGSELLRSETGFGYITLFPVDLDAATVQVTVRANSDQDGNGGEGADGNLNAADELSFINPLPNVASLAVVDSTTVTAADAETEAAYRARVTTRFQAPPQGGAYADYKTWGLTVTGIIYVYPYTSSSPGEVDVYCEATEASSGSEDGIPTTAQLTAVATAIELEESGLATRRPVSAGVNVYANPRIAFDVEVTGLNTTGANDDEATIKTRIGDACDEWFRSRESYIVGLSTLARVDRVTRDGIGGVVHEVASAAGATFASIDLQRDETSIIGYTLDDGEKAKLGEMEWA